MRFPAPDNMLMDLVRAGQMGTKSVQTEVSLLHDSWKRLKEATTDPDWAKRDADRRIVQLVDECIKAMDETIEFGRKLVKVICETTVVDA
ncbi:hypothetical protein BC936DRAFT_141812 [Jimgerdemannia flammicorona]|uniref:Uncharacterized protein n=1 Tax=Jimgerdemannia flammicorona TaxID=994334 RepID=A0A433A1L4_9FUNG|nr:hypothetical protein BC936DRAFT_141812 [Jimgerdemannia flammicorona]